MTLSLKHKKANKTRCTFCGYEGVKSALEVHHIDGNHENNDPKNLIVLCVVCHRESHEKQKVKHPNAALIPEITEKPEIKCHIKKILNEKAIREWEKEQKFRSPGVAVKYFRSVGVI